MKRNALFLILMLAVFFTGACNKIDEIFPLFPGTEERKTTKSSILSSLFFDNVNTVEIPALPKFIFKDNFTKKDEDNFRLTFWGDRQRQFIETVEEPKSSSVLQYITIGPSGCSYEKILKDLGGEHKVVVTFAQIYHLIEAQKEGNDGPLLVVDFINGTRHNKNLFFVRDKRGVVYPVEVKGLWKVHGGRTQWYVSIEFFGEVKRLRESHGIFGKSDELIPGDVVFYPK